MFTNIGGRRSTSTLRQEHHGHHDEGSDNCYNNVDVTDNENDDDND